MEDLSTENAAAAELGSSPIGYCNGLYARRTGSRFTMDVIVTPAEGGTVCQLTDLLGRSMGRITASVPRQFMIHPEGHASETMAGIQQGPHASLDAALAEIERHTRGVCRGRRMPRRRGQWQAASSALQLLTSTRARRFTFADFLCRIEVRQQPYVSQRTRTTASSLL
jgi:hypothetical protein